MTARAAPGSRFARDLEGMAAYLAQVTDQDPSRLKGLRRIGLSHCRVTDLGVGALAALGALERLDLDHCEAVSDRGVGKLASVRKHPKYQQSSHHFYRRGCEEIESTKVLVQDVGCVQRTDHKMLWCVARTLHFFTAS